MRQQSAPRLPVQRPQAALCLTRHVREERHHVNPPHCGGRHRPHSLRGGGRRARQLRWARLGRRSGFRRHRRPGARVPADDGAHKAETRSTSGPRPGLAQAGDGVEAASKGPAAPLCAEERRRSSINVEQSTDDNRAGEGSPSFFTGRARARHEHGASRQTHRTRTAEARQPAATATGRCHSVTRPRALRVIAR